jgi:O-methyltransferase
MSSIVKHFVREGFRQLGYDVVAYPDAKTDRADAAAFPPDLSPSDRRICQAVAPFTMTSAERVAAVIAATRYIVTNGIEGDFVECGVWRGGSTMAIAHALIEMGATNRHLYLYDTFAGMSEPGDRDKATDGTSAAELLEAGGRYSPFWCYAGLREVTGNVLATGFPESNVHFVQGKVEETIPDVIPSAISLLRLDTDWYESTMHELTHLYPRLSNRGVLIVDDYGHWLGAKEATDEYFERTGFKPLLQRIDYTGRLAIKTNG